MSPQNEPQIVARQFFQALMQNQCHLSWSLFSKKSQEQFLDWSVRDIYARHPDAAAMAKLGRAEVRLLFENNDASLMKTFWKRFFYNSGANDFFRFGYFHAGKIEGSRATVDILCKYPDGREAKTAMQMVKERGMWKLAYVESNLPF